MRLVKSNNKWIKRQTPSKEIKQINKQTNSVGNQDGKRRQAKIKTRHTKRTNERRKRDQQQNKAGKYTQSEEALPKQCIVNSTTIYTAI